MQAWDIYNAGLCESLCSQGQLAIQPLRVRTKQRMGKIIRPYSGSVSRTVTASFSYGSEYNGSESRKCVVVGTDPDDGKEALCRFEYHRDSCTGRGSGGFKKLDKLSDLIDVFLTTEYAVYDRWTGRLLSVSCRLFRPCWCWLVPYPGFCPRHDYNGPQFWRRILNRLENLPSMATQPHSRMTECEHVTNTVHAPPIVVRFASSGDYTSSWMGSSEHSGYRSSVTMSTGPDFSVPLNSGDDPYGLRRPLEYSAPSASALQGAIRELLPAIKAEVNLPVFIAEMSDITRTLAGPNSTIFRLLKQGLKRPTSKLHRGGPLDIARLTLRDIANANLWWNFGVSATANDVRAMIELALTVPPRIRSLLETRNRLITSRHWLYRNKTSREVLSRRGIPNPILRSSAGLNWDAVVRIDDPSTAFNQSGTNPEAAFGTVQYPMWGSEDSVLHLLDDPCESVMVVSRSQCNVSLHWNWDVIGVDGLPISTEELNRKVLLDLYGLNLNPNIIWEVIPFSFVADWFLTIGDWLESFSIRNFRPSCNLLDACWTIRKEEDRYFKIPASFLKEREWSYEETDPFMGMTMTGSSHLIGSSCGTARLHRKIFVRKPFVPSTDWLHFADLKWRLPSLHQVGLGLSLLAK